MSKIELPDVTAGYSLSRVNANFSEIEAILNDDVLWRNNPTGEPNEMLSNLDMNGKRIYNLPIPILPHEPARLQDIVEAGGAPAATMVSFLPYKTITATNVQEAIEQTKDELDAVEGTISGIESSVIDMGNSVDAMQVQVNSLNTKVDNVEIEVDGINGELVTIQNEIDDLAAQIGVPAGQYTRNEIASATIDVSINIIRSTGYYAHGDGGDGLYKRVGSEPSHIGKVQSADGAWWELVFPVELDIRAFGGKYNDISFNNSPILTEVLKLGTVTVPAHSIIYCQTVIDVSNVNVKIVGKSMVTSRIHFLSTTNGFSGTHVAPAQGKPLPNFILSDLVIETANDPVLSQNTAIGLAFPEGFFAARFMAMGSCTNVNFRGANTELSGWGTVVRTDNMLNFFFVNCIFNGKDEGGAVDQNPVRKTRSLYGVFMSGGWVPCEVHFTNCQFYHFNEAVYTTGSYEGLYVTDCAFISCGTGIRQFPTTFSPNWPGAGGVPISAVGRPLITVKGTHMNIYTRGVYSTGVVQGLIQGCALYHNDHAVADANLITVENGSDWMIVGNVFRSYAPSAVGNGVVLTSNANCVTITSNNFATKGTGILIMASSGGNNIENSNIYKGSFTSGAINEGAPGRLSRTASSLII